MPLKFYTLFLIATLGFVACEPQANNDTPSKTSKPTIKDGLVTTKKKNGKIASECMYKDNEKNGPCKDFYDNGQVRMEINYVNGKKDGVSKFFRENGELFRSTPYKNDSIHGIQTYYHPKGVVMAEVPYQNGNLMYGTKEYDGTGKLMKSPTLLVNVENLVVMDGSYTIQLSVKGVSSKKVKFYETDTDVAEKVYNRAFYLKDGIWRVVVPDGRSLMEKVYFIADVETSMGVKHLVSASHFISVSN